MDKKHLEKDSISLEFGESFFGQIFFDGDNIWIASDNEILRIALNKGFDMPDKAHFVEGNVGYGENVQCLSIGRRWDFCMESYGNEYSIRKMV